MSNAGQLIVTTPTDREIVLTRVFDAPRRLVFDAFTKPELIKRWLIGPPGWSLVVCETAAKVGDKYRFVWRSSDGAEMGMGGVCREFVPPERMVATEKFDQAWYSGEAVSTIVLTERDGKTTLTQTIQYESRETRDAVLKTPMADGMGMGYDRLDEVLASVVHGASHVAAKQDLVITRIFDAPIELVWKAWVEPERVMRWWGPMGFTSPLARMDFREGGTSLVCMQSPQFGKMYSTWHYRKIAPLDRIEYIHNLADADGNKIDPATLGMPPDFPRNQPHTILFKSLGGNRTELTVTEHDWAPGHMMGLAKMGMEQCLDKMAASFENV